MTMKKNSLNAAWPVMQQRQHNMNAEFPNEPESPCKKSHLWPELLSSTACQYVDVRTGGARAGPRGVRHYFGGAMGHGAPARPGGRAGAASQRRCPHDGPGAGNFEVLLARPAPRRRLGFGLGGALVVWPGRCS